MGKRVTKNAPRISAAMHKGGRYAAAPSTQAPNRKRVLALDASERSRRVRTILRAYRERFEILSKK